MQRAAEPHVVPAGGRPLAEGRDAAIRHARLHEHRREPAADDEIDEAVDVGESGLALGTRPLHADDLDAVRAAKVAKRVVRGHQHPAVGGNRLDLATDAVVDRRRCGDREAFAAAVGAAAPGGVHVWWEALREPDFDQILALLAERGRIVLMAGREARPALPVGPFYVREATLTGFVMFKASWQEQAACAADLNRWMAGGLRAPIGVVMPLAETAAAHRLQEEGTIGRTGRLEGKIVVEP